MDTWLLNPATWDLAIGADGSFAIASNPYSLAQDVACAVKCFNGECWYNTDIGVPYFEEILGQYPPTELIKRRIEEAALSVTGVISAKCIITTFENRQLVGQIQFTDKTGIVQYVNF